MAALGSSNSDAAEGLDGDGAPRLDPTSDRRRSPALPWNTVTMALARLTMLTSRLGQPAKSPLSPRFPMRFPGPSQFVRRSLAKGSHEYEKGRLKDVGCAGRVTR